MARRDTARSDGNGEVPRLHSLRDYALLADGERGALIGPDGQIVWMCFPQWDDDAIFSSLLGGEGRYSIGPLGRFVWGGYYEEGGLVWRSRWVTDDGIVECREALTRPTGAGQATILRRLHQVEGAVPVRVVLHPRAGFGDHPMVGIERDGDVWCARTGGVHLRWRAATSARAERDGHHGHRLVTEVVPAAGEPLDFVLEFSTAPYVEEPPDPARLWRETEAAWAAATPDLGDTIAPRDARHAHAVIDGMTSPLGGTRAAATTSLPERADEGRNYDYRYVWVRDQCIVGQAAAACGSDRLVDTAVRFVTDRVHDDGADLVPAYTGTGDPVPETRRIGLPGYPGGTDHVGNDVRSQFQLDTLGEVLGLLAAADGRGRLDVDGWRAAERVVDGIAARHREPDNGIWELGEQCWTHSRLECVAGLRAIARARQAPTGPATHWEALADAILADVSRDSLHATGRWQRAPGDERVDAALLQPIVRGALPVDDPRSKATHDAVVGELGADGYVYRFRHDERPLADAEGAFLLCSFWVAMTCSLRGEDVASVRWFERARGACGPPGLLSEEFDVVERQLRGNLPQTFVHAALLETAARLAQESSVGTLGDARS